MKILTNNNCFPLSHSPCLSTIHVIWFLITIFSSSFGPISSETFPPIPISTHTPIYLQSRPKRQKGAKTAKEPEGRTHISSDSPTSLFVLIFNISDSLFSSNRHQGPATPFSGFSNFFSLSKHLPSPHSLFNTNPSATLITIREKTSKKHRPSPTYATYKHHQSSPPSPAANQQPTNRFLLVSVFEQIKQMNVRCQSPKFCTI